MLRKILILLGGCLTIYYNNAIAQQEFEKSLQVGNKVPDLVITMHIGDSVKHARLSDFRGKLVIIDFWSTHCGGCINLLPHMLELQEAFKSKLQIIIVDPWEEASGQDSLWKNQLKDRDDSVKAYAIINAGRTLPFVFRDSSFAVLFPVFGLPSHVWIDSNGYFYGQAYSNTTTAGNIESFITGKPVRLAAYHYDPDFKLDTDDPLQWLENTNSTPRASLLNYSFFRKNIADFPQMGFIKDIVDSLTGLQSGVAAINQSMVDLYKKTYAPLLDSIFKRDRQDFQRARIIIESDQSAEHYFQSSAENYTDWTDSNLFCYALKLSDSRKEGIDETMRHDLDNFFHFTSHIEKRQLQCVVLKRFITDDKLATKGGVERHFIEHAGGKVFLVLQNAKAYRLSIYLQGYLNHKFNDFYTIEYLDSSGLFGSQKKIDIRIPWSEHPEEIPLEQMRKAIRPYGLDIVEEYTPPEEVLVLHQDGYDPKRLNNKEK
jgi:thiol-disulfide isomerase/thioredoxin